MIRLRTKDRVLAGIVALVVIAVLSVSMGQRAFARSSTGAVSKQTSPTSHTITVSGHGDAMATPDMATLTIGVQTKGIDAQSALSSNASKLNAVVAAIQNEGVAANKIKTSDLNLYLDSAIEHVSGEPRPDCHPRQRSKSGSGPGCRRRGGCQQLMGRRLWTEGRFRPAGAGIDGSDRERAQACRRHGCRPRCERDGSRIGLRCGILGSDPVRGCGAGFECAIDRHAGSTRSAHHLSGRECDLYLRVTRAAQEGFNLCLETLHRRECGPPQGAITCSAGREDQIRYPLVVPIFTEVVN